MNKKAIFIFFLCFLSLFSISKLIADQRIDNIEIYLVLDKSLSMVEEIDSVKDYVIDRIINRLVIEGDYFILIPFYGKADNSFNGYIKSSSDIDRLRNTMKEINADGRFTDIGNALNTLRTNIKTNNADTRKYMLLITDGKQEAPLNSPFYSSDGSFNHEFLENTKEIQKQGWKIVVLGIGTESDAEKVAKELSAGYTSVTKTTTQIIDQKVDNFLGRLDLLTLNNEIKLDKNGNASIVLEIKSSGYDSFKDIKVIEIQIVSKSVLNKNILVSPFVLSIKKDNISNFSIPVTFPESEEDYTADIIFIFEGENSFSPAVHTVTVQIKRKIPVLYFIIVFSVIVFAIIIYYLFIIIRRKKMEEEYKPDGFH